jgi:ribosomal-protein-alanine N-acetyltransferase
VTALSESTVHLAQVAVHPRMQGRGLAGALVVDSCSAARAKGFEHATLLVDQANQRARALYARLGFTERARFVAAHL